MTYGQCIDRLVRPFARSPRARTELYLLERRSMPRDTQSHSSASVSAVLPAYNEEIAIETSVRHLAAELERLVNDFEIIVTNDGSRDGTGAVLNRLQAADPSLNLRVITHEHNQGYGAALAS